MMLRLAALVAAVAAGLYWLTGGDGERPPVAEGRSWRLVPGVAQFDWSKVADAAARFVGEHAWLMVQIANKGGAERVPVMVVAERQIGPRAIAGRFIADDDHPLPHPWGPKADTPVEFALEDVWLVVKD